MMYICQVTIYIAQASRALACQKAFNAKAQHEGQDDSRRKRHEQLPNYVDHRSCLLSAHALSQQSTALLLCDADSSLTEMQRLVVRGCR